jgi:hypothetical protein
MSAAPVKNAAFMSELKKCISKSHPKHCAVGGFRDNTSRGELKDVISRIRDQLDVLDRAVFDPNVQRLDEVADRACNDIGALLCDMQNATGAIVRQGAA